VGVERAGLAAAVAAAVEARPAAPAAVAVPATAIAVVVIVMVLIWIRHEDSVTRSHDRVYFSALLLQRKQETV